MGRGLSDLQKLTLNMAYSNRQHLNRIPNPPEEDLRQQNVLRSGCFGFPYNENAMKASMSRAISRLVQRGLMTNLGDGWVKLTEAGLKIGEGLYRLTLEKRRASRRPRRRKPVRVQSLGEQLLDMHWHDRGKG